jgi:hypothetical protein
VRSRPLTIVADRKLIVQKLKSFAVTIIVILALAIGGVIGQSIAKQMMACYKKSSVESALIEGFKRAEAQYAQQLPMRIDEYTILQSVGASGKTFNYNYTVEGEALQIESADFLAMMRPNLAQSVCSQADMRKGLEIGAHYNYNYSKIDGAKIGEILITSSDC